MLPRLPQADLIPAVERYLAFVQQMAEINRHLSLTWVQAASALSHTLWQQIQARPPRGTFRVPGLSRAGDGGGGHR